MTDVSYARVRLFYPHAPHVKLDKQDLLSQLRTHCSQAKAFREGMEQTCTMKEGLSELVLSLDRMRLPSQAVDTGGIGSNGKLLEGICV